MRFGESNFLYAVKQIVTGKNGDDTPVSGTTLPGNTGTSSSASADGGIKVDKNIPLGSVQFPADFPAIVDNTVGTPTTTFAALTGTYATDVVTLRNDLAQIALQLNALHLSNGSNVSNVSAIVLAAGATTIGTVSFAIPRDYDEASDHLALRLMIALASGDTLTTGTVTGTATVLPIATGVPVAESAVTATAPFSAAPLILSTTEQVFSLNFSGYGLKRDDVISIALAITGTTSVGADVYAIVKHFDSCIVSYNDTDGTDNPSTAQVAAGFHQPGFGNALR